MTYRWITGASLVVLEIGGADADPASDLALAQKFSPILILTEETSGKYGDIRVTKPEPVEIVGANSVSNLWFEAYDLGGSRVTAAAVSANWNPSISTMITQWYPDGDVDFRQNMFAFFTKASRSYGGFPPGESAGNYIVKKPHFDYPGPTPAKWNSTYFGDEPQAGCQFPNTSYVHVYDTTHVPTYEDSITVIFLLLPV